jgi:hypothetical protein
MEDQGPFDRILETDAPPERDRAAVVIVAVTVAVGLILLALVLPPISLFEGEGGASRPVGPVISTLRDEQPAPPEGFELVSGLMDISAQGNTGGRALVTVELSARVGADEALLLYTYQDGRWRRLGEAVAVSEGQAAQGEVPLLPPNIAVLRRASQTRLVLGALPAEGEVDPRAAGTLTTLNPTGFTPAPDGRISGGPLDLPEGLAAGVAPTIGASSPAEIETLNAVLGSADLRAAHAQAIAAFVRDNNLAGIDLDYRALDPARAADFVALVRDLSDALGADGKTLTIALPVPVRDGAAFDTHGYDWDALAPLVTAVRLGGELQPDTYYASMEAALGYLVPRVAASKLLLQVSSMSVDRGADGARALTLTEALTLASDVGTQAEAPPVAGGTLQLVSERLSGEGSTGALQWDGSARAVSFRYAGPGGERTVWLANLFSEAFKLDLAHRYQLGGVAVGDVSRAAQDANLWPALEQYAASGGVDLVLPNGDLLQPHWSVSSGQLEQQVGALTTWRLPDEPGTYTATLTVSDGLLRVGQELTVAVAARQSTVAP